MVYLSFQEMYTKILLLDIFAYNTEVSRSFPNVSKEEIYRQFYPTPTDKYTTNKAVNS